MKRVKAYTVFKIVACASLIFFGGALIAFPARYAGVCLEGICMWAESVLPNLFPFMIITVLIIKLGAVDALSRPLGGFSSKLNLPAAALPLFVMSACSGYPAGVRLVCEYCNGGLISRNECKKLAPLCSACGPLFALGTIGVKAFGGGLAGVKLWCASLASVVITSLIYCARKKPQSTVKKLRPKPARGNILESAFSGGVSACCTAGGFICFFYTLAKVFDDFKIFMPFTAILSPLFGREVAGALCTGLVEATGGCFALAACGGFFALPLAGFLATFGGLSILLQQIVYIKACGVSAKFFVAFKLVQGFLCFTLLCLLNLV